MLNRQMVGTVPEKRQHYVESGRYNWLQLHTVYELTGCCVYGLKTCGYRFPFCSKNSTFLCLIRTDFAMLKP